MTVELSGLVEPGFGAVADAFRTNFTEHGDVGAGFCLYVDGAPAVDLTAGTTSPDNGAAYGADALQLVFSTTKGAAAVCAAMLVADGKLDYEAPVTQYWPEFGAEGKGELTVAWLLSHRCGLVTVDDPPPLADVLEVGPIVEALAVQAPLWELDGSHGYHALTYGWLVGELVRCVSGLSIGDFFQQRVAQPLGLDFWIGLPEAQHDRVAPLLASAGPSNDVERALMEQFMGPATLTGKALMLSGTFASDSGDGASVFNRPEVWASEIPAANGITNASSLARMYAATIGEVDGVQLFDEAILAKATAPVTSGADRVLMMETKFAMGFMTKDAVLPLPGTRSFGHAGAGGSLGYADPDLGIGFGYVMNQMSGSLVGDPRTLGLTAAVLDCVS